MNKIKLFAFLLCTIMFSCDKNDDVIDDKDNKIDLKMEETMNIAKNSIWIGKSSLNSDHPYEALINSNITSELYALDDNFKATKLLQTERFTYGGPDHIILFGVKNLVTTNYIMYDLRMFYKTDKQMSDILNF